MMIARTPENSWSELITSVCLTKAKVVSEGRPGFTDAPRMPLEVSLNSEQSCTASLAAACHG
jgi:hypothetical protein